MLWIPQDPVDDADVRKAPLLLGLLLLYGGCRKPPPKPEREIKTTSADIWLGNLDGQISELERLVKAKPEIVTNLQRLSSALHTRARYRGDPDEIQAGIDRASECIQRVPDEAKCFYLRAEQEQSLHRFKEARADLARARELGIEPGLTIDLETELDWNDGLYDKAIPAIRKARADRPSMGTWLREAQLEHELGNDAASEAAFAKAEAAIRDVSPLPVANLDVQRGIVKTQRGQLEEACTFFRKAVARMPGFVAANEHLAETLHTLGKDDEAIAIYERVVASSRDPEFVHALAEIHARHGKAEQARAEEEKARARYDELLAKYPEAMYWHASEFFMEIGDRGRALDLLHKNLTLRPNSTSYVALARAEYKNGDLVKAKAAIDAALAMPLRSATLFFTASKIYDGEKAKGYLADAKKLNPRVETDDAI
jgi:tetratricopeptide (TPR) repeat protein